MNIKENIGIFTPGIVVNFYYSDMPETYIFDCKVQKCL